MARGVFIALPVLVVFGTLLVMADAAFEALVTHAFYIDPVYLPGHLLLTFLFAWIVGGFLYGVLVKKARATGETDEAEALIRRIINVQPNSPQAHWSLAGARTASDRHHIEQMQQQLARVSANPRAQAFYLYGIGKELEDLEDWDAAFGAFEAGARARRQTVAYDEPAEIEMFEFLDRHFTQDWLDEASPGHHTDAPIFVLGQPRTGTTLIERIISSHSRVHSAGELQQFSLAIRRISRFQEPERFSSAFFGAALPLDPAAVGRLYMDSCARMRGTTRRFVDKLPQNYLLIPLILAALPDAKIVHLTRDPMDACFASYKQLFADAYLHSYDQEEMARHHARYRRLLDVWRERFGDQFLDISYEETVSDLEPNVRRLLDFLALPWEDGCLKFHEQEQAVSTASAVQVRQPVHTRSVGRWRRYGKQLEPMRLALEKEGVY